MEKQTKEIKLREYQHECVESVRASIKKGNKRILLVMPTGAGKTMVASYIISAAREKKNKVLFIAHRKELIEQTHNHLKKFGIDAGVIMAKHPLTDLSKNVQIASIQTLVNRSYPQAELIFIDEAHRTHGETYKKICQAYLGKCIIGLTATPIRLDKKGLGDIYDDMIVGTTIQDLISDGYLVSTRHFIGDENAEDLTGNIINNWKTYASDRKTVIFTKNVEHSKRIVQALNSLKHDTAMHLDANTPRHKREAILKKLEKGEIQVLSNCNVLSEGWDMPSVSCCVLARSTDSLTMYLQQAGRVLRPAPDKKDAIILDHGNCFSKFGKVEKIREWELKKTKPKENKGEKGEAGGNSDKSKKNEESIVNDGVYLTEITDRELKILYFKYIMYAKQRGWKIGWAYYQIVKLVGKEKAQEICV